MPLLTKIGKTSFSKFAVLIFSFAMILPAFAQAAVTVTGTVDRNALNPDDTLTFKVAIESTEDVTVGQPTLPSLTDFELLNEWTDQRAQASMVSTPSGPQFKRTWVTTFNFMLMPKREGNLNIGGVEVVVDGKAFVTKPISIRVAPGAGVQGRSGGGGGGAGQGRPGMQLPPGFDEEDEDLFSQLLRRVPQPQDSGGSRTLPINPNEAFFIQVDADKTEAYVGEQITVSFYIYTRGQIRDLDTLKYPSLKGFWKEDIEIATQLNFENEVVNGIPYKKALLASFALFPIKEGSVTVDEYKAKCSVIAGMDAFSGMGFGKAYTFTKSSRPIKINVKPLPSEGRPSDFSGAVGEYQVTARVDDKNIVEGQPFTLKLRFEGRGNAKNIELPPFQPPEGIEMYDKQDEARFYRTGTSFKEFSILMIPRREGEFTIPSIGVSMFDIGSKQYINKKTEPLAIRVGRGNGTGGPSLPMAGGSSASKPAPADETPRLITEWKKPMEFPAAGKTTFWTSIFGLIAVVLVLRARSELGWGQRKKDLMRQLRLRLRKVEARADSGDWRGVGAEMTNTVYFVLGEISGEGGANMEFEKLMLKAPPSVRRELAGPLAKQMETFNVLCFAPESVVGSLKEPENLKKAVKEMDRLMERAVVLGLSAEQSRGYESNPTTS